MPVSEPKVEDKYGRLGTETILPPPNLLLGQAGKDLCPPEVEKGLISAHERRLKTLGSGVGKTGLNITCKRSHR